MNIMHKKKRCLDRKFYGLHISNGFKILFCLRALNITGAPLACCIGYVRESLGDRSTDESRSNLSRVLSRKYFLYFLYYIFF